MGRLEHSVSAPVISGEAETEESLGRRLGAALGTEAQ